MKKEEMIELAGHRLKKIRKHITLVLEDFQQEDIHSFRVEIKKLKAFLHLLGMETHHTHSVKLSEQVILMYHYAGFIRNLQLQIAQFYNTENKPLVYLRLLQDEERLWNLKARELGGHHPFAGELHRLSHHLPEHLHAKTIRKFIQRKEEEFGLLCMVPVPSDEALHKFRKTVKELIYTWSLTGREAQNILPGFLADKENLILLSEVLGSFHDLCSELVFFGPSYTERLPEGEIVLLEKMRLNLEERKRESKELIHQELIQLNSLAAV